MQSLPNAVAGDGRPVELGELWRVGGQRRAAKLAGAGEELHGGAEGVANFRRHVRLVRESVDARDGLGRRAAKGVEERLRAGWLLSDASGHRQTGRAERRGHGTDEGTVLVHLRHISHMRTNFKRSWQIAAPIARAKSALVTGWRVVRSVRSGGIV